MFFGYFLNTKKVTPSADFVIGPAKAEAFLFSHTRLPFPPRPLLPFGRISPAAKPGWPVVAPAGGNVLATPFSLCSNVAPHIPAGSAGVRSFVPRLAPRSHPGAQLRFILKQLYASGCPFLRNFPFFSSVPHPFFASAPGRTDTQKSAAGIPRRGFNTFSVSWLYFPLPNT